MSKHYEGNDVEPIDVIEEYELGFHLGAAVKYILRAGKKEGEPYEKDLFKALDFIHRELYGEWFTPPPTSEEFPGVVDACNTCAACEKCMCYCVCGS